jgi:HPt (histidine-containing phosphotransfer) domain-containing protein
MSQNTQHLETKDTLERLGGDRELLHELYQTFAMDTPGKMDDLLQAQEDGDMGMLQKRAHSIKGAAAAIGAVQVRSLAQQTEQAAGDEDAATLAVLVPELGREVHEVLGLIAEGAG